MFPDRAAFLGSLLTITSFSGEVGRLSPIHKENPSYSLAVLNPPDAYVDGGSIAVLGTTNPHSPARVWTRDRQSR
jgi:hypothetical protein